MATLSGVDKYIRELYLSMGNSVEYVILKGGEPAARGDDPSREKDFADAREGVRQGPRLRPTSLLPLWLRIAMGYVRDVWALARELRPYRDKVDLLHVVAGGCEISPIAAKLAGLPRVLDTVQAMYSEDESGQHWVRKLVERICFRCGDYHIFVSDATHDAWKHRIGFSDKASCTIFNGMRPPDYSQFDRAAYRRQFYEDHENTVMVGICARLHHMKGHLLLLEAFAEVLGGGGGRGEGGKLKGEGGTFNIQHPTSNAQHPTFGAQGPGTKDQERDLLLLIAGEGPERAKIEKKIDELGIGDHVKLLGHRTDPCDFTASLDLHVMPSLCIETIGYANIEAMFAGVPCIVSDTGGMKEIVGGSNGGAVVPAGNLDALVEAMDRFVNDEQLRFDAGERGRAFAHEMLTAKVMVDRTFGIYRDLVV